MCTIPFAVLSVQEGGELPVFTLTVLPLGAFSVPVTHVLLQPAAQTTPALSQNKVDDTRESRW
jgi:hypothetical protein